MTERTRYTSEGGPIRVLHVDDDACFLKAAKAILEMQGAFQVETALCVDEAWEKMKKADYEAVVSDYQMPGKDGLQFLKELRQKGSSIPFLVFTGKGREEVVIKALNQGADHYENKNGDPDTVYCELGHAIRTTVERKRAAEERLKAEKALRESKEKYRTLASSLPEIVFEADEQGKLIFVNERAYAITGHTEEDFAKGLNSLDFPVPEHRSKAQENLKKVLNGEKTGTHEYTFQRKDGSTFPVLISSNPVVHEGKIVGLRGIIVDISERARMEEELQRFSSAVKMSSEGVAVTDLNGKIIEANDAVARI
jgi:PAS domain S-box-containing protein